MGTVVMRVLVTGGAGFVGNALVEKLVSKNYNIDVIDTFEIGKKTNSRANYIKKDVCDIHQVTGDYDICFHLAALSRIQPSFTQSLKTFKHNAYGTAAVLEWARVHDTPVIYAGSSSKFAGYEKSPYAASKYIGEVLCEMYRNSYNLKTHIVRFYNVYGPGELTDDTWAAIIGRWRSLINDNKPIEIVGDGNQSRSFTHIDDIVDGLIKISENIDNENWQWDLGCDVEYSVNDVFEMFKKRYGDLKSIHLEDQSGNYRTSTRNNDNAINLLGCSFYDRLEEYIMDL